MAGSVNIGSLVAHIKADTIHLQKGMARSKAELSAFGKNVGQSMATAKGHVMSLKGALVGLAGAMALKKVVNTFADFEHTMLTVKGVSRATKVEFKGLSNIAREMGRQTEWSASQAASGLKFMSMAGFEAGKSIKALPGVLDLATAGNIELGTAADIATNALAAMGMAVGELGRVNDVFVGTITRSNTNMEMMAESFKYAAPSANAFGYSIEELSAMIGVLGNAGIQASTAGTQLSFGFAKTSKVFDEYGVSAKNADGTTKSFIDALELMNERGASTEDFIRIFGMRAGRAALVLKNAIPQYEDFVDVLYNTEGEAKNLAELMRTSLRVEFEKFKSVVESLAIDIGADLGPGLKTMLSDTSNWAQKNGPSVVAVFDSLGAAFKAIGFVLGEAADAWAGAVYSIASGIAALKGEMTGEEFMTVVLSMDTDVQRGVLEEASKRFKKELARVADEAIMSTGPNTVAPFIGEGLEFDYSKGGDARQKRQDKRTLKSLTDVDIAGFTKKINALEKEFNDIGIGWEQTQDAMVGGMRDTLQEWVGIEMERVSIKQDLVARTNALEIEVTDNLMEQMALRSEERKRLMDEEMADIRKKVGYNKEADDMIAAYRAAVLNSTEKDEKETAKTIRENAKAGFEQMAADFQTMGEAFKGVNKEMFFMYKATAIASAMVATYDGATKAYESMASIPYVGHALGIAAAAAAVGAGLAKVAIISQQTPGYAEGGIASGPSKGYPVTLHGTEAIIPLGNGGKVPVDIRGGGEERSIQFVLNVRAWDGASVIQTFQEHKQLFLNMLAEEDRRTGRLR